MKVEGRWRRTIERAGDGVAVLDQTKLPYEVAWMELRSLADVARAIKDMHVRGAPLIGATAAYGVAIAMRADAGDAALEAACAELIATRPTAINLAWAVHRVRAAISSLGRSARAEAAAAEAAAICDEDVALCAAIGDHGEALLRAAADRRGGAPVRVLTHCNAGWLATVDWGTALAPIYKAHARGLPVEVWVDETRPRNQGLLTAWELAQQGIPHTVIADNAGGLLMQRGDVDLCIVGTDRTTRGGDVCNKIGTYLKALAASDNHVPFYAAVPSPSIDWTLEDASTIHIEERSADEVRLVAGHAVVPAGSPVANPAFDVTPHRLVTGLVTERGVVAPGDLRTLFPERFA